jgi:hypothetical protein
MKNWKVKRKVKQVPPATPVGTPSSTCWGPIYTYLYMSSILSKSPIYVHATIHLRNNGAHRIHYTNVQSEGVEYSRRLPKNLRWRVEGLSPSWAEVTSLSKKNSSNSSKSSSYSTRCASIACSNSLRQRYMVEEAPALGKNNGMFRVWLHRRLGCPTSKCPAAFPNPSTTRLECICRAKMTGNNWGCSYSCSVCFQSDTWWLTSASNCSEILDNRRWMQCTKPLKLWSTENWGSLWPWRR